jgi:DNA polymerase-3 subunit gamma/tau
VAIAEDRHVDVLEMDAASRTGVDDVRDIIDGVLYRPASGRYKVYIIDEVHMLSRQAFNALLKTLEEPPPHVKFVFATTEIRKVPVTVLSRCQRFDLRRVPADILVDHLKSIAGRETVNVSDGALRLIARAADGSVRDALSLFDQAIAHRAGETGALGEDHIRAMIGLADSSRVFDLFDAVMRGKPRDALTLLADMYDSGADPVLVLTDLLELSHWLTRVKLAPDSADDPAVSENERTRGKTMAAALSIPVLTRAWQLLLKGITEAREAPNAMQAAEMVLVRLSFAAELPTPAELIASANGGAVTAPGASAAPSGGRVSGPRASSEGATARALRPDPAPLGAPQASALPVPQSFPDVIAMFEERREALLRTHLINDVHLVRFEVGAIEFRPAEHAPAHLANRVSEKLREWTGMTWFVSVSAEQGEPTVGQQRARAAADRRSAAISHPLVQAALETFPGAEVAAVRERAVEPEVPALPDEPPDDGDEP